MVGSSFNPFARVPAEPPPAQLSLTDFMCQVAGVNPEPWQKDIMERIERKIFFPGKRPAFARQRSKRTRMLMRNVRKQRKRERRRA